MQEENTLDKQKIASAVRRHLDASKKTQHELASTVSVNQALVSRVINLKFDKITDPVKRLYNYAVMHTDAKVLPEDVSKAVAGYLASGGDSNLLCRILDVLVGTKDTTQFSPSQYAAINRKNKKLTAGGKRLK